MEDQISLRKCDMELYIAVGTNLEDGLVTVVNGHHADRWLESPLKFPVRFSGTPSKWPAFLFMAFFFFGGGGKTHPNHV